MTSDTRFCAVTAALLSALITTGWEAVTALSVLRWAGGLPQKARGNQVCPAAPRVAAHHQPDGVKVRDTKVADLASQLLHREGGLERQLKADLSPQVKSLPHLFESKFVLRDSASQIPRSGQGRHCY
ncbi:Glycogen Phosphorylase, Brain Form [Manis pentadactyla]|nr:Glycogen Phosphorylase, Brain Form [Manis pentadactyla]